MFTVTQGKKSMKFIDKIRDHNPRVFLLGLIFFALLYPTFCFDPHLRRICFHHGRKQSLWTEALILGGPTSVGIAFCHDSVGALVK